MPYVTSLESSLVSVNVAGEVVFVPNTAIGNAFGTSEEYSQYDVDSPIGTTLFNGDNMALIAPDTSTVMSGNYIGAGTITNGQASVNIPGVATITLQVAPISGYLMQASDGTIGFMTQTPLDDDHIMVRATATVAGVSINVTAPISGITEQLALSVAARVPLVGNLLATTIRATGPLLQNTANTAIVTMNNDLSAGLPLDSTEVVPCFVQGTLIRTETGDLPVEVLKVGQRVMTVDHGAQRIRWIGHVRLDAARLQGQPRLRPIRIRAGALGDQRPCRDLLVSPQHRVLLRSRIAIRMFSCAEVLVAAKHLVGIDGIEIAEDLTSVTYCHFLCDRHELVISDGAVTESMYPGAQAMKAIGTAAVQEILSLFPELRNLDRPWESARQMPRPGLAKKLTQRQLRNQRPLIEHI